VLTRPNTQTGFSLIELIIVIAIVGILFAAALPNYRVWIQNTQTRTATESLQNGLRLAQVEAVRRNTPVDLVLTNATDLTTATPTAIATGRSWVVRVADATAPQRLIQVKSFAEGTRNVTVAAPAGTISFSGLGRTTAGTGNIDLTNAGGTRNLRLVVAPGGSIRMCDPALASSDAQGC
jgi:type IV fimbrial biogenesis protein FimT